MVAARMCMCLQRAGSLARCRCADLTAPAPSPVSLSLPAPGLGLPISLCLRCLSTRRQSVGELLAAVHPAQEVAVLAAGDGDGD